MGEYLKIVKQYEMGLLTKSEANRKIDFINMGSDYNFYPPIK